MKTYGTCKLDKTARKWRVTCEPQVSLRLKRVFGRLSANSQGVHLLSDTIEVARDIEWFIERYPLEVTPASYLRERADAHKERLLTTERLLAQRTTGQPFDLAIPPREYQRVAASLLLASGSLLLVDDVGLGKTASAICTFTDPRSLPALVVTMAHLPKQWADEIAKFAPKLRTHIVTKSVPYDLSAIPTSGRRARGMQLALSAGIPDVIIINYHKLAGWAETLSPIVRSVVYDEAQELRTGCSDNVPAKYRAAELISASCQFRLGLTATPIYNYGGEFYAVLNAVAPGTLGELSEFRQEWTRGSDDKVSITDPKAFGSYLREQGLMLRRTRAEVGRELPGVTKVPHHIDADLSALDKVSKSCAELARLILQQGEAHRGQKMMASEEFSNALRQATGIAKAPFVASFVRLLVENGESVVLYGWHRAVYDIWLDTLKDLKPAMFTGSETASQKEKAKQAFIGGETKILIVSLRAGAGMDGLQHASRTVVFGELDWSHGVHDQCTGRVARDGQKDPVVAYFLIAESGADPIMVDVLGLKRQQLEGVRDPDADLVEVITGVDANHIKLLAEGFLRQRGLPVPAKTEVA